VVASPKPKAIIEATVIQALIQDSFLVIAVGGGGIPVVENEQGDLVGVEAVIDKDYASALLANSLGADVFVISTAVERVAINYKKANERWLDRMTLAEAKQYLAEGQFPKGSMGPKIEASIAFLERGGQRIVITSPENIERSLAGESGTWIVP
jgi:carbamate kinase